MYAAALPSHEAGAPPTFEDAIEQFSDPKVAYDFFVAMRFPNGVVCPRDRCWSADVVPIKDRAAWWCASCKRQFTAKVGTIFQDSPLGFEKWLPLLSLVFSGQKICQRKIAARLHIRQKTVSLALRRVRKALRVVMLSSDFEPLRPRIRALEKCHCQHLLSEHYQGQICVHGQCDCMEYRQYNRRRLSGDYIDVLDRRYSKVDTYFADGTDRKPDWD